jgi:hypothetical protein
MTDDYQRQLQRNVRSADDYFKRLDANGDFAKRMIEQQHALSGAAPALA